MLEKKNPFSKTREYKNRFKNGNYRENQAEKAKNLKREITALRAVNNRLKARQMVEEKSVDVFIQGIVGLFKVHADGAETKELDKILSLGLEGPM